MNHSKEWIACDECEYLEKCIRQIDIIDCTMIGDARPNYICGSVECIKNKENK